MDEEKFDLVIYFNDDKDSFIIEKYVYESYDIFKRRIDFFDELYLCKNYEKNKALAISSAYMNTLIYGVKYNEKITKLFPIYY